MSDNPVATMLSTDVGELAFQRYFVQQRCAPRVSAVRFDGAATAKAAPGVVDAILNAEAVLIAPSNPYLSVDPVLAIDATANALKQTKAPIVAVSPLVGGKAVKGPTAKLMDELGVPVTNASIAMHYRDIIDGLLIDSGDEAPDGIAVAHTDTLMKTLDDRVRVARAALDLAQSLRQK